MKKLCYFIILLINYFSSNAQDHCGFSRNEYSIEQINAIETLIAKQIEAQKSSRVQEETIRIPIVVHVIHNNPTREVDGSIGNSNISADQIISQIKALNEDFRKKPFTTGFNYSPVGADMNIEFMLYKITRHYTEKTEFKIKVGSERLELSNIANIDDTPSSKFLNIFIANFTENDLGYTEFPAVAGIEGLSEQNQNREKTDGVYIHYRYFGREKGTIIDPLYSWGRTATHEIGHWLGLIHIWGENNDGCGSDYCNDTPPAQDHNLLTEYDCSPVFSECIAGTRTKNMIENYMDYSPDKCMNIFTQDQKARSRAVLALSPRRISLIQNSKVLSTESQNTTEFNASISPNPAQNEINIVLDFLGIENINLLLTNAIGECFFQKKYFNLSAGTLQIPTQYITNGTYFLSIQTKNGNQIQKILIAH